MGIAICSNDGVPTPCVCTLLPSDAEPNGDTACPGVGWHRPPPPSIQVRCCQFPPTARLSVPTHSSAARLRRRQARTRPHAHLGPLAPSPPGEGVVGREGREAIKTGNV